HVTLHGNDEPERRVFLAGLDGVLRLLIEILNDQVWKRCRQLQRAEHARLHVVRVVAAREARDRAVRHGKAAIPLAGLSAAAAGRRAGASAASRERIAPFTGGGRVAAASASTAVNSRRRGLATPTPTSLVAASAPVSSAVSAGPGFA